MHVRLLVACSLLTPLATVVQPAVAAKPKPVCHLVVDPKGDGHAQTGGQVLASPALDITGADVATGKKQIVAVLRLATTSTATVTDPVAALGMQWSVHFKVRGTTYSFERRRVAGAEPSYRYEFNGQPVPAKETATEVRFTADRARIPDLGKYKNLVVEGIAATSGVFVTNADAASTTKKYKDLTPSCLKAL